MVAAGLGAAGVGVGVVVLGVGAQRMSTYKILAASFGQQRSLPDCTDDCRRQLNAITDELLDRLRAAGEIDPALTTAACHTIRRLFKKYHTNVKSAPSPGALFLIQNGLPDPFGRLYNTRCA